jgi:hypothetical protein
MPDVGLFLRFAHITCLHSLQPNAFSQGPRLRPVLHASPPAAT